MSYNTGGGFNSQHWYDTTMDRRTREELRRRTEEFEQAHENDSDEALLALIRERAQELGYVPFAVDCLAGRLVGRRFGAWIRAVKLAGLPSPTGAYHLEDTRLYREEYKRQQKLHRAERAEKMARRRAAAEQRQRNKAARKNNGENGGKDKPLPCGHD